MSGAVTERLDRLESLVETQQERIEAQHDTIETQRERNEKLEARLQRVEAELGIDSPRGSVADDPRSEGATPDVAFERS